VLESSCQTRNFMFAADPNVTHAIHPEVSHDLVNGDEAPPNTDICL
jgi:hypothetical protein